MTPQKLDGRKKLKGAISLFAKSVTFILGQQIPCFDVFLPQSSLDLGALTGRHTRVIGAVHDEQGTRDFFNMRQRR